MRSPTPPIRFLLAVVCGWAGLRAAMLAAPWDGDPAASEAAVPGGGKATAVDLPSRAAAILVKAIHSRSSAAKSSGARSPLEPFEPRASAHPAGLVPPTSLAVPRPSTSIGTDETTVSDPSGREAASIGTVVSPVPVAARAEGRSRWSASAWVFARRGRGETGLVPAGALGGSQFGARMTYRLGRPAGGLSLSLRLYTPLSNRRAAEAALGLEWKPRALPLRLLVERRTKLGRDGRSAFALAAYGGADDVALGPLRLGAYGQAGAVGARRRDLFADGAVRLTAPLGRLRIGAGAWAAAQPGVSRVDAGPHADLTLAAGRGSITFSADWRFRLAGAARPGSGPAITLSTGF